MQIELIDALIDAGASLDGNPNNALVNGTFAAAEHLVRRGATLTLATALCLGRWDDVSRLVPTANDGQKQFGFVLAALNGKTEALRRMIRVGVDLNRPSEDLYSHATPLHHAVWACVGEGCRTPRDGTSIVVSSRRRAVVSCERKRREQEP